MLPLRAPRYRNVVSAAINQSDVVLALFVVFWLVQTEDLWDQGIRPRSEGKREPSLPTRLSRSSAR